ncbi:MAG: NUDIX domain-containing protein, partial [Gammaproteobacteria bacterium]|nr:NUDIX domain-containing protein [Gammaproteobacteria bacterium]
MNYHWKLEKHEVLFEKYFRLEEYSISHELFAGGQSEVFTREIFERGTVVAILPYDPERRKVVLIEQFRAGAIHDNDTPWLMECVAGVVESGEAEDEVAIRESQEEAGCEIKQLHHICKYYVSP